MSIISASRFRSAITLGLSLVLPATASDAKQESVPGEVVTISTGFPGGNVSEDGDEGDTVHLSPDLRGDNPWFYWCFEAKAVRPGRVRFVFPEKVAGFPNGALGFQGPAISTNGGETWNWMGTDTVKDDVFTYTFTKAGETVRFAVTIPYLQSNLDSFLARHDKNPHLMKSGLTKSRGGREVELLRIGTPGPGKQSLLLTARHHAAETIASYVLEGLLEAALAESPDGLRFRERYVLYAVPFVDKDGVESGDQGKNRKPHDHNRDYREDSLYPEVRAIKKLQTDVGFRFALDFHCPTLVMEDHQVMYFAGPKSSPPNNLTNVSSFAGRIQKGLLRTAPHGPLVWLRDEAVPTPMFSQYFGTQDGVVMSATLEVPFAPPGKATDPASCREYGRVVFQSFLDTQFLPELPNP